MNKNETLRCRILFSVGGKGGVGKTWLIGLLSQWLKSQSIAHELYDCDDETSTTSRFFPNAKFLAIRSPTQIDEIINSALGGAFKVVLADLPARAGDEFQNWFSVVPWLELAALGIRFTSVGVVSGAKDSLEAVLRWHEFLMPHALDHVIALNRRDDLGIYFGSRSREKLRAEGVPEFELPKLDENLASALDAANWTLSQAIESTEPHHLTRVMNRARLQRYRNHVYAQFETVRSLLVP